jgi:membrane fusion protein (multidrug efflux system)
VKKLLYYGLAIASLSYLGWWVHTSQRSPVQMALEIVGAGSTSKSAPSGTPAAGGQGSSGRPAAATGGPPGGGPAPGAGGGPAGAGGPSATGGGPAGAGGGPPSAGGGQRGPTAVEAARARTMALADDVFAVGTLRANESVVVKPEIAGRIVKVAFSDGAAVRQGQLLIELDASVLAAQAEQVRAELALSQATHDRTADLAKRNFVSESARDQAAANLNVQQARLRLAEAQLAKTRIVAPFNGVLGLRNVSLGDFVREGAELVVLEDVSSMKVDLRLPERYFGQLRRGQRIDVGVDAFPEHNFIAVLDAVDVQVDANGRALMARGRLDNREQLLRTGMFAKARIVLKDKPEAVVVPEEAIIPEGSASFVYRVIEGKARRTPVVTGIRRDGVVELVSGVQAGEMVITAGQLKLQRDGQDVRVLNSGPQGAGRGPGGGGPGGGGPGGGGPGGAGGAGGPGASGPGASGGPASAGGPASGAAPGAAGSAAAAAQTSPASKGVNASR